MPDGSETPAEERERKAWEEFWELVGKAAYQLWRDRRAGDADQESA